MVQLCLLRHGESLWNKENRFTGWVDVPLTDLGREQAEKAGELIKKEGLRFQVAYTSVLNRAIETLEIVMKTIQQDIPVIKDSALNERMYGDLQGLNKEDTAKKYGSQQVHIWRRSYDIKPPNGESLEDTQSLLLQGYPAVSSSSLSQVFLWPCLKRLCMQPETATLLFLLIHRFLAVLHLI